VCILDSYIKARRFTMQGKHCLSRENLSHLAQKSHGESGKWRNKTVSKSCNTVIWRLLFRAESHHEQRNKQGLRTALSCTPVGKNLQDGVNRRQQNFVCHKNCDGHFGLKVLGKQWDRRLFPGKRFFNWELNESLT